jgi:hypothetical protein
VAFLIDHIKRKHASNLEAAAGSAFFSDVSQKGRCEMGENLSSTESFLIPAVNDDRTKKYKLNGQVVPMLWKIPSAADRSLSEATSLPLWHDV